MRTRAMLAAAFRLSTKNSIADFFVGHREHPNEHRHIRFSTSVGNSVFIHLCFLSMAASIGIMLVRRRRRRRADGWMEEKDPEGGTQAEIPEL